ncbi:MAG: glycine zipper 2TM domain-containing protein [Denitratisoma sp.]|nr:glycine zipper 2TM domain-containing protein [Denitratisoma sp.]
MEAQVTGNKLHPLLWVAAVAVIILSAAGVAAIFGVIPTVGSSSKQAEPVAAEPAPATAPATATKPAEPAPARKVAAAKPAESKPAQKAASQPAPAPAICANCGTIESVTEKTQKGEGTGIGAVAGGVAGAVLGSQVGKGSGKTAATVIGGVGGAVAGHQAERYIRKTSKWEIIVRFEDGTAREFDVDTQPVWRVGDKVRVENNVITAR